MTDLVGFLCLVPAYRRFLKRFLKRRFARAVQTATVSVTNASAVAGDRSRQRPMKDVPPGRSTGPRN